jgi:hypothetical protein
VTETGRYEAVELERLVEEAAPSATEIVFDLTDRVTPVPPSRQMQSAPPVAVSMTPVAVAVAVRRPAPAASRNWRTIGLVAAACVGIFAVVGVGAELGDQARKAPVAAAAPPPPETPTRITTAVVEAPQAPAATGPSTVTFSANDLPNVPVAHPPAIAPATPRAPVVVAAAPKAVVAPKVEAPAEAPAAPAAAAPAVVAPAAPAAAPIQPKPKAADDDLRHFLDDRR